MQPMSVEINGLQRIETHAPPEADEALSRHFTEIQLAFFGAGRLLEAEQNPPSSEAVEKFLWRVEEVCTGDGSGHFAGISARVIQYAKQRRSHDLGACWNPAGTVGGFDADVEWEGSMASLGYVEAGRVWMKPYGGVVPRPYAVAEGIFFDAQRSPRIRRVLRPLIHREAYRMSSKLASATDVEGFTALLDPVTDNSLEPLSRRQPTSLPIHLEVGYGLDPTALLGKASYLSKIGVQLDRAVGTYENSIGDYPDAVRLQTQHFAEQALKEKPGENILFVIGDGGQLPLPDNSVRQVFLSNVLNAPLEDEVREATLQDAGRVLPHEGSLVVRVNWHEDEWPHDKMVRKLASAGFTVARSVFHTSTEYHNLELQYGTPSEVPAPAGYYLIATR